MSFKRLIPFVVVVVSSVVAVPITPINRLPSITTDTIYPIVPPQDSQGSESIHLLRNAMSLGTQMFQSQIKPQRQEAGYVTLFRLPFRIARSVSQTGFGVARSFMDTFAQQFMESYNHMQRNVIPKAQVAATQAYYRWAFPPKPHDNSAWLDGGV